MFDRFDPGARQVCVHARQEALRLNHDYIGTEHLLLGLLAEGSGAAGRIFESLGLDLTTVRAAVISRIEPGSNRVTAGQLPFTDEAKRVLELTLAEAIELKHSRIANGHILLGLLRQGDGIAAQALRHLKVSLEHARGQVREGCVG